MLFSCFPNAGCEWFDLRRFVVDYNATHGTEYRRIACLDQEVRDRPAADVLVASPESPEIVIERKSVVWPPDFLSNHRNMHDLVAMVGSQIDEQAGLLREDIYQLRVHSTSLDHKKKREIKSVARSIVETILAHDSEAKQSEGIRRDLPFPWWFGPLPVSEREDYPPKNGLGILVNGPLFPCPGYDYEGERERALEGVSREVDKQIEAASAKLRLYQDCIRMLMIQFFAPLETPLCEDDVIEIVQRSSLPDGIDEVWVADQEFYDPENYEIVWKRVAWAQSRAE